MSCIEYGQELDLASKQNKKQTKTTIIKKGKIFFPGFDMGFLRSHTKNFTPYPFVGCVGSLGTSEAKLAFAFLWLESWLALNSQLDTA